MSQVLEEYPCKFCNNTILSGYRCTDCYIKNITEKIPNPYKDHSFEQEYDGEFNTDVLGAADLVLEGEGFQQPWIKTFTTAGNASNLASTKRVEYTVSTPSSATMGFGLSTNTKNGQNTFYNAWQAAGHIPNEDVRSWRSPRLSRQLRQL